MRTKPIIAQARWIHHGALAEMTMNDVARPGVHFHFEGCEVIARKNSGHSRDECDLNKESRDRALWWDQVPDDDPGHTDQVHLPKWRHGERLEGTRPAVMRHFPIESGRASTPSSTVHQRNARRRNRTRAEDVNAAPGRDIVMADIRRDQDRAAFCGPATSARDRVHERINGLTGAPAPATGAFGRVRRKLQQLGQPLRLMR